MPVNNNITTITKYLPNLIDDALVQDAASTALIPPISMFDYTGGATCKIATLSMPGLAKYDSTAVDGTPIPQGALTLTWKDYTLSQQRAREMHISSILNDDAAGIPIAYATTEFTRTKIVPELDAYRFATIASATGVTMVNSETSGATAVSKDNVISKFEAAIVAAHDKGVKDEDLILYVSPQTASYCRLSSEVQRYSSVKDPAVGIITTVMSYNGIPIQEVASDRFGTTITVSDTDGYTLSGHHIDFLLVNKKAVSAVMAIDQVRVFDPTTYQGDFAWCIQFLLRHDCFVFSNKASSIYCHAFNAYS